jgi:hypothetical protein
LLGVSGPAPEVGAIATTYNAEIDTLKHWINLRLDWLDESIPGFCTSPTVSNKAHKVFQPMRCFPNPSNGLVLFEGDLNRDPSMQILIFDVTGKLIEQRKLIGTKHEFNFEHKNKGVYYFHIVNKEGLLQTGKIVII